MWSQLSVLLWYTLCVCLLPLPVVNWLYLFCICLLPLQVADFHFRLSSVWPSAYTQRWTFSLPDTWSPKWLDIKTQADNQSTGDPKSCDNKIFQVIDPLLSVICVLYLRGWISDSYANISRPLYGHTHILEYTYTFPWSTHNHTHTYTRTRIHTHMHRAKPI